MVVFVAVVAFEPVPGCELVTVWVVVVVGG